MDTGITSRLDRAADHGTGRVGSAAGRIPFDAFYRDHADTVARAIAMTLNDDDLASDATNEAMTRAYQRWAKVSRYDNPAGWVYRVALNWALSWKQRRRREREQPHGTASGGTVLPVDRDDTLDRALDQLSVDHRAVVVCRLHLDWSVDQTAAALDIKPGTVKSRLARALDQLRHAVAEADRAPEPAATEVPT